MPIDAANQLLSHQRGSSSGDRHLKLRTHDSEKEVARRFFLDSRPGLESLEAKMKGIRSRDFSRLDSGQKCVYLDYTGAMLAPSTLVRDHTSVLQTAILGNPHSVNAPSAVSSEHDHDARTAVLKMTRASSHDYTVIWTINASGALKTVAEAYPFGPEGRILYAPDCHNSVVRAFLSLPREFH
jgi:selenocysteine lyase/cysteine desulfurase